MFLNAMVVTPAVSAAITSKLKRGNRTLVWTYMAGVLPSATAPRTINTSMTSDLVGVPLTRRQGSAALFTHVPHSRTLTRGFPRDYGSPTLAVDPCLYYTLPQT